MSDLHAAGKGTEGATAVARLSKALGLFGLPLLVAWAVAQKKEGFFVGLIIPSLLLFALVHGYWVWRGTVTWQTTAGRLGPWVAVVVVCSAVHWSYRQDARQAGDAAVAALERFRQTHGRFPETFEEAGLNAQASRLATGLTYANTARGPELSYPATFVPFDHYLYDFEAHRWRYVPGSA